MATSETEIVNSALIKIGEATITSLSDERTQAQVAARQYPLKRQELLRSYRWNFSMSRANLAPEAEEPPFGFSAKFLQPNDCLRVIGVYDEGQLNRNYTGGGVTWKVEGPYILANADTLPIFYLRDERNPLRFDALFAETLSWFLAYDLAYKLSTGPSMVEQAYQGYQEALRQARLADAVETTPEILRASEWLESRIEGGGGPPRIGPVNY